MSSRLESPTFSYVIPYRCNDQQARAENLDTVLRWLSRLPEVEVIVAEQDEVSRVDATALPSNCVHVFTRNAGPFNKSWGVNVGFKTSSAGVIAFGDADLIINPEALRRCFDECNAGADAVKPYDRLVDLTREESRRLIEGDAQLSVTRSPQSVNREGIGEFICFCGGLFLIKREAYLQLGGFDEAFLGWGAEDDAMTIKLTRSGLATRTLHGQTAFHLWHERSHHSRYGHAHYARNAARLEHYATCDDAELLALCREGRQSMGDALKYASG